ncbi:MAG: NusG antitermination factor [Sphingobacteriales bacterium]|nr:NusG antitermination factor [Sphingobacteriales bacterium]
MESKWYAIYTQARWEKKVATLLTKNNVENYCPLNKVVRQWSDRKKVVEEPLFTSYVFVKITEKQQSLVRQIDGVINFVYWLGKPAVIRNDEIEMIQLFLVAYMNVKLEKTKVSVKDIIRIVDGPLSAFQGEVIAVKKKTIKVLLPKLGYLMYAEIETDNVEVIIKHLAYCNI